MSTLEPNILSIIPPIVVLALGFATKRVLLSIISGIIVGALIATKFSFLGSISLTTKYVVKNLELETFFSASSFWDTYNLFICIFLLMLGIFVTLLQHSGGAFAYSNFVKKFLKTKKGAEVSSLCLSTGLFIDDYFSSLTVGSVMHPITDKFKIPRVKIAYLVDSMSAPLAILCPFSSWVAAILGFLKENGINEANSPTTLINAKPLSAYLGVLPFITYSFVVIFVTWFVVLKGISFGLMAKHEKTAVKTGNLFGGKTIKQKRDHANHNPQHTTLTDFFIPIGFLLVSVFVGMAYSGSWSVFGGEHSLIIALQNSSAAKALFLGGILTLLLSISFFLIRDRIKAQAMPGIFLEGCNMMLPAIIVLILAWTLGDLLRNELQTGEYLAGFISSSFNTLLLPCVFFVISTLIAFMIGSSWGAAAMIFPIAIPMVVSLGEFSQIPAIQDVPILLPLLGAVLSGCVAGDHISPISDTTIMSTTSTKTPLMEHVHTQLPYAMPMIVMTGLSFALTSYLAPISTVLAIFLPMGFAVVGSMIWLKIKSN